MKWPVGILEDKLDFVLRAGAVAQRLRKATTIHVCPMRDIAIAGVVEADHDDGFVGHIVLRGGRLIFFVDAQELMIEHPFCLNRVFGASVHHFAGDLPVAQHHFQQRVLEVVSDPVQAKRVLGNTQTGTKANEQTHNEIEADLAKHG